MQPLIHCKCGKCSCDVSKQHEKRHEEDMLQQFLLGLYYEYYAPIRSNILAQDPLPSLNKAYKQVSQEELVRGIGRVKDDQPLAVGFAVRTGTGRGRGLSDRHSSNAKQVCTYCKKLGHLASNCFSLQVCTHCKKISHDVSRCYDIIGYPEGWNAGDKGTKPPTTQQPTARHGRGTIRANAAASSSASSTTSVGFTSSSSSNGQVFTTEQWKVIMGFFSNAKISKNRMSGKFDTSSWIIDTDATHHVTGENHGYLTFNNHIV